MPNFTSMPSPPSSSSVLRTLSSCSCLSLFKKWHTFRLYILFQLCELLKSLCSSLVVLTHDWIFAQILALRERKMYRQSWNLPRLPSYYWQANSSFTTHTTNRHVTSNSCHGRHHRPLAVTKDNDPKWKYVSPMTIYAWADDLRVPWYIH
jgi:hypothetical protein